jgi:hypothetical protein
MGSPDELNSCEVAVIAPRIFSLKPELPESPVVATAHIRAARFITAS